MPIDLNSDMWKNARSYDVIGTEITSLLTDHREQAFSVKEIEEHLYNEHQHLFPDDLVGDDPIDGAKAARQSIVSNILEYRYWRSEVTFQYVSEDDVNPGLYYTWKGVGISPIAEIDDVTDPNPDSPFGVLSSRFRQIEKDVDDDVSDLEERISHLEYRFREEIGSY
ncbi:hypothetical protein [Halomicrobium zhouii]|nr:hypothetical protein [Halomicrobium zhouii]